MANILRLIAVTLALVPSIAFAGGYLDSLNVGNLQCSVNTIATTNTNGDLTLTPNGTGKVIFSYGTVSTVPYLDSSKKLVSSVVTPTELGCLSNVTSSLCGINQSCTVTNKLISGSTNTFSNIPNSATTAVSTNTVSTIVLRDGSGNFSAGTVTAAVTGNASTATALAANGSNCSAGQFPLGVDASGASESCTALPTAIAGTANQITASASTGSITLSIPSSPTLPGTTSGTFSGNLTGNVTGAVTGNASTSTALAANGANCSAGSFPLGVDASGASESCTALPTTIAGTANQITVSASTGAITISIPSSPTLPGTTTGTFSGNTTGTHTGSVVGNASTATALAANGTNCSAGQYGLGVDASGNSESCGAITVLGTIATGVWNGTAIPLLYGGTGQTTKAAAFDALSPMTTSGDIIYGGASGTGTRLAKGSDTNVLTLASGLPTWAAPGTPAQTVQTKTANYTVLSTDDIVLGNTNAFTFTLYAASAGTKPIKVCKIGNDANLITIARAGSDVIVVNGGTVTSTVLHRGGECLTLTPDGSSKFYVDSDVRTERARISCTSSSSVTAGFGAWVSAVSNVSNSLCTATIVSGIFSASPSCSAMGETTSSTVVIASAVSVTSATSVSFFELYYVGAGGSPQPTSTQTYSLICTGPR